MVRSTNQIKRFDKSRIKRGELLNNHFCKKNQIHVSPNDSAEIVIFHFSHYYKLPLQPEFLSNRNKKHNFMFPPSVDAMCVIWKESAIRLQRNRLKIWTDAGCLFILKAHLEPKAQVS